jgi:tetratricopeptide (TPR) repeat protein
VESRLKKAAALDPRLAEAHLQLGILYAGRQEYPAAVREYERAIKLKPDLVDAHYRLGQAYVRTGEKDRAKVEFGLYEDLHKKQSAESEKQRAEIQQFIYSVKESPKP